MAAPKIHPSQILPAYADVGDALVWDGTKWAPGTVGGGGGPVGYAEVSFTFSSNVTPLTGVAASAGSLDVSLGDPGVTVGTDSIDYADQSLYMVSLFATVSMVANTAASDAHSFQFGYDPILGDPRAIAIGWSAGPHGLALAGSYALTSGGGTSSVVVTSECTGGTDREYDITFLGFYITRWALPT